MSVTQGRRHDARMRVLRVGSFELLSTCGDCANGRFPPTSLFGRCVVLLHPESKRPVLVPRSGSCPRFEWKGASKGDLHAEGFMTFAKEGHRGS